MSEVIVRQYYDGEDVEGLWDDYNIGDMVGMGESTIWDIFDNEGKLYLHAHSSLLKEGVTHPYPQVCEIATWSGPFTACDLQAIEREYNRGNDK